MQNKPVTLSLCFLICISAFSVDITIPTLPGIAADLGVEKGMVLLVVSAYLIGYALFQVPVGYLSEKFSRVSVLFGCISLYLLGCLVCVTANELNILLLGRLMQGLGAAGPAVLARAIARDVSTKESIGKMMSSLTSSLALTTLTMPILSSVLVGVFSWQVVFVLMFVFGSACIAITFFIIAPQQKQTSRSKQELNLKRHIVMYWQNPASRYSSMIIFFAFMAFMSVLASFSSIAQDRFSIDASHVGWILAIFMVFYLMGATLTRKCVNPSNETRSITIAVLGAALSVSLAVLALIFTEIASILLVCTLVCFMISKATIFSILSATAMRGLPSIAGSASGILGTCQIMGAMVGASLSAFFYSGDERSTLMIIAIAGGIACAIYAKFHKELRH